MWNRPIREFGDGAAQMPHRNVVIVVARIMSNLPTPQKNIDEDTYYGRRKRNYNSNK